MASLNQQWFDAQMRHAVQVQRFTAGEARLVVNNLRAAETELTSLIAGLGDEASFKSRRAQAILRDIRAMRQQTLSTVAADTQGRLFELAGVESAKQGALAARYYPMEHNFAAVDPKLLQAMVRGTPFAAGTNAVRTLDKWWGGLIAVDQQRITEALQMGMIQGETVNQMVKRVRAGLDLTRHQAATVVRTGVKHTTSVARDAFFDANSDVCNILMWAAMLDGRTTVICASRDGHYTSVNGDMTKVPRPHLKPWNAALPAHPNCRSNKVAILSPGGIAEQMGERAFVRSAKTPRKRNIDFRKQAHAVAGDKKWRGLTPEQRQHLIKKEQTTWTADNVGRVPVKTTYDDWLRTQPSAFQDDALGKGKAALFRDGMKLDKYVDEVGRELSLKQLVSKKLVKKPSPMAVPKDLTIAQLEKLAVDRKLSNSVSFYRMDPDVAAELVEVLSEMHTGKGMMFTSIGPRSSDSVMFAVQREFGGANLRYSTAYGTNRKIIMSELKRMTQEGTVRMNGLRDAVTHEYGHFLSIGAEFDAPLKLSKLLKAIPGAARKLDKAVGTYYRTDLEEQFAEVFRFWRAGKLKELGKKADWSAVDELMNEVWGLR